MRLINLKDLSSTMSFDCLYINEDWSVSRGFVYNHKGKNKVLVGDQVYEDGEVVFLGFSSGMKLGILEDLL